MGKLAACLSCEFIPSINYIFALLHFLFLYYSHLVLRMYATLYQVMNAVFVIICLDLYRYLGTLLSV